MRFILFVIISFTKKHSEKISVKREKEKNMMYFNDVNNLNELKSRFRQWAFKLHPDKGGNAQSSSTVAKGEALPATQEK